MYSDPLKGAVGSPNQFELQPKTNAQDLSRHVACWTEIQEKMTATILMPRASRFASCNAACNAII